MRLTVDGVILYSLFGALITAQPLFCASELDCTSSLALPTKGLIVASGTASGTVEETVEVGLDGSPNEPVFVGGDKFMQAEVRVALGLSRFKPGCAGRKLKFIFEFTLLDMEPSDKVESPYVEFIPPNRFNLTFRRRKPIVDIAPPAR